MKIKALFSFWAVCLFLVIGSTVWAQIPQTKWSHRYGGSANDIPYAMLATSDGGYIIAGSTNSPLSGDITEAAQGGNDFWVIKVDSIGVKLWNKRFGGTGDDQCKALAATDDGGFILAGFSNSGISGDKTEDTRGGYDYWVVKIDSLGNKVWDKRFGGVSDDQCVGIVSSGDGGFVLAGSSNSATSGDKTENCWNNSYDYWMVKINAIGAKVWSKRLGGTGSDSAVGIVKANGGFVILGNSNSGIGGDKTTAASNGSDYWAVKLSATAAKVWDTESFGQTNEPADYARALSATPDGGFLFVGQSPPWWSWRQDSYLVKIDANGQKVWSKLIGYEFQMSSVGNDDAYCVTPTSDGGFLVSGWTVWGDWGSWIYKIDANGNKLWQTAFDCGYNTNNYPTLVVEKPYGFTFAAPFEAGCNPTPDPQQGAYDFGIVRMCLFPNFSVPAPYATVCAAHDVTLSVTTSDTTLSYLWQPGGFTTRIATVQPLVTTTYTVTMTNGNGCQAKATRTVKILASNYLADTIVKLQYGKEVTLTGPSLGNGITYQWLPTGETTPSISVTEPGIYSVAYSNGSCTIIDSVRVDSVGIYEGVTGKLYLDKNLNGAFNTGEPPLVGHQVSLYDTNNVLLKTTTSDAYGNYYIPWPSTGAFKVRAKQTPTLTTIQPNAQGEYTEVIGSMTQVRSGRRFGFRPSNNLKISISPKTLLRQGQTFQIEVNYCNDSPTINFSGNIQVALDPKLNYTGQTVFPFVNLQKGECRSFLINGIVPTTAHLGDTIHLSAEIIPSTPDDYLPDNVANSWTTVRTSYDPNLKTAFVANRPNADFAYESDTIDYTIYFQNTGTDTAFSVILRDTLDAAKYDITSLELVDASHKAAFTLRKQGGAAPFDYTNGIAVWRFDNILLPDSNTNEPASHGFVRFRIKPKAGTACNSVVKNRAGILFDYNPVVVTNSVSTTINPTPTVQIVVNPTGSNSVCPGNPIQAIAVSNGTTGVYTWEPVGMTGDTVIITPNATTIYTLTADFGYCSTVMTMGFPANVAPIVKRDTFYLAENSLNGVNVGTAIVTNPNACETLTYAITSGNTGGVFAIDPNTGLIKVANGGALNFEGNPTFSLYITATDNGFPPKTGSNYIIIKLIDVLETITLAASNASCSAADGTVNLTVSDGTPPFTYLWSNGGITEDLANLTAGDYWVTVTDANGKSVTDTVSVQTNGPCGTLFDATLKVFLEGAYRNGADSLTNDLYQFGLIPNAQPYNIPPYNYAGTENYPVVPDYAVDWVLIELRDTANPTIVVHRYAALLTVSGQVIAKFNATPGKYLLTVSHRNHLTIGFKTPVTVPSQPTIDLANGANILGGASFYTIFPDGKAALMAGDNNTDKYITAQDYSVWSAANSGVGVFHPADMNMDGFITVQDYQFWVKNNGKFSYFAD